MSAAEASTVRLTIVAEIEVKRVLHLRARHAERFLRRCFSPGELATCLVRARPDPGLAVRLAARVALAEFCRNLGLTARVTPHDAEVIKNRFGAPRFRLSVEFARTLVSLRPTLCVAHTRDLAVAVVATHAARRD